MSGIRRRGSTVQAKRSARVRTETRGMRFRRTHGVLIGVTARALIVSACGAGKKSSSGGGGGSASGGGGGGPITVGTTDKVTAIDPAGSDEKGSVPLVMPTLPHLHQRHHH